MYAEAYLLLVNGELGHFQRVGLEWTGEWRPLAGLTSAAMVEGLGMGILRLLSENTLAVEYRFSLRHAREVGRLQRQLERRISRKEVEEAPEPSDREEKKVRCDQCGRVIPAWSEICPACTSRRKVLTRLLDYVKTLPVARHRRLRDDHPGDPRRVGEAVADEADARRRTRPEKGRRRGQL